VVELYCKVTIGYNPRFDSTLTGKIVNRFSSDMQKIDLQLRGAIIYLGVALGLNPIVTSQYSSTILYQVSYRVQ
jgi:hypothetical protein